MSGVLKGLSGVEGGWKPWSCKNGTRFRDKEMRKITKKIKEKINKKLRGLRE